MPVEEEIETEGYTGGPDDDSVENFLSRSRQEFSDDYDLDKIDRDEAEADNKFANSSDASKSQWDPIVYEQRKSARRPILQTNLCPVYIQHVANAGRQNKPEIKTSAGDGGNDATAQFYESRIRQILYESKAEITRDTMREQQITSGRAFGRITTEYIPGTKKQRQVIKRIENQFSVVFSPAIEYDKSDADRCWVVTRITKEEHKRRWGNKSLLNREDFATRFDGWNDWVGLGARGDLVQIAEKFEKEYDKADLEKFKICRYIINGAEILEKEYAISPDFDIVPQWGSEAVVDGVQRHFSLINRAKDDQRLVNLYKSNIAELIAAAPKDRYDAPIGSIPTHMEDDYKPGSPKSVRYYHQWDPDDPSRQFNKPEYAAREAPIQAAGIGLQQAIEGMKSTMGIWDASLGQRSNETSGVAINRRKVEGETINYHFTSNEARTWDRVGQILIRRIDILDKGRKELPVRHEDGKTEMVPIGQQIDHPRFGKTTINLDSSTIGVRVEQGLSYANSREQKQERDQALVTAVPELMFSGIGVSMIRNSQYPGADEDADSLVDLINLKFPGLIPKEPQDGQAPLPPAVQQQIMALQQENQKLHQFAQSLHEQIQTKAPEIQSKLQIAQMEDATKRYAIDQQELTKRTLGLATIQSEEAQKKFEEELGITHATVEHGRELELKQMAQQHAIETQVAGQAHEEDQAEAARAAEPAEESAE